mmetsp:Transcript_20102/g.34376  ORF Transcript_20102/g.34376 Transcript_20102/m.34376 type:complete len:104 (+) Transcript_20102:70-381(+)
MNFYLKLIICVIVDTIGFLTYLIPGLGEAADVGWAPISGFIIYSLFQRSDMAILGFAEELLPGLDFIPTACVALFLEEREKRRQRAGERTRRQPHPPRHPPRY